MDSKPCKVSLLLLLTCLNCSAANDKKVIDVYDLFIKAGINNYPNDDATKANTICDVSTLGCVGYCFSSRFNIINLEIIPIIIPIKNILSIYSPLLIAFI